MERWQYIVAVVIESPCTMLKFVQKSMTSRKEACSTQKSCLGHVEVLHFVCLSLYFFLAALMLLSQPNSLFYFSPVLFFFSSIVLHSCY